MNLRELSRRRWRTVAAMSAPLLVLYIVFMLIIAFYRNIAATQVVPGVSVAILLDALLITGTWLTTWLYVRWANRDLDQGIRQLSAGGPAA